MRYVSRAWDRDRSQRVRRRVSDPADRERRMELRVARNAGRTHQIARSQSAKRIVRLGSLKQVPEAIRGFPVWARNAAR